MKLKHAIFVCLVIALAALLLTACNPNTPEDTTAPTTTAPTTTVPPVTTTEPSAVVTTTVPPVTTTVPTPIVVTPTFTGLTAEYDGEEKTVAVGGLPAGATVSYSINGGATVSSVAVSDAGTYTVVAYITLPVSYVPVDPMTATITITKKSITIAALAPFTWVYDEQVGYDAELDAIRVDSDDVFSYTMTLDADTLEVLAENGITVSYTTVKAVGTGTEDVANEVTARGVYRTVAVLTVDGNNYEATDDGYEIELDWAICLSDASSWTPVVK